MTAGYVLPFVQRQSTVIERRLLLFRPLVLTRFDVISTLLWPEQELPTVESNRLLASLSGFVARPMLYDCH